MVCRPHVCSTWSVKNSPLRFTIEQVVDEIDTAGFCVAATTVCSCRKRVRVRESRETLRENDLLGTLVENVSVAAPPRNSFNCFLPQCKV